MLRQRLHLFLPIFAALPWLQSIARAQTSTPVDFGREIQPIFAASCISCHGPEKQKGGLRLDVRSLAMDGGTSGKSILPGKGNQSLLTQRLRGEGDDDQMPLKKDPLTREQIATVARWIDEGAKWPDSLAGAAVVRHWAFEAPTRPPEPVMKEAAWPRNPIDRFILARLEKEHIRPSPEAPRETLLRRVSLDLTGLPPTPQEIDAFVADTSPDAYEKVVDRLLASPHYGERWARHWLDGARYADSNGYSIDAPRSMWPYRDWVVNALNKDMPFDRFTIEQLAGDLLPQATTAQKIATGFHRNTQINEEGGIDKEQFRVEAIVDRVATTGAVFMGLTIGCAQCHNHKFDPISQREYYQFFAFFNNADEPKLKLTDPMSERQQQDMAEQIERLQAEVKKHEEQATPEALSAWEAFMSAATKSKLKRDALLALKVPPAKRNEKQQRALIVAYCSSDPDYVARSAELATLRKEVAEGTTTLVMAERAQPRDSFIFVKGDFTRHGDAVTPGVPAVLPSLNNETPSRLDLARWIVDPKNPLTARVQVNRLWMHYFGKGLVETDSDFGTQGSRPTHPELLDWLATEFVRQGWSLKGIARLIVTSAVYRQSSNIRPELALVDPDNKLLARQARVRLDAEVVRDIELAASGLLSDRIGGPSVFPPQPEGVMGLGQVKRVWKTSTGFDRYRRGLYTFTWRSSPHPLLTSFDAPDLTLTCTRRARSNTPLQALTLLNDAAFFEFAQALTNRTFAQTTGDDPARIAYAFELCTGRKPTAKEIVVLTSLLAKERSAFADAPAESHAVAAGKLPAGMDEPAFAAWTIVCRAVLNLDEAITRE